MFGKTKIKPAFRGARKLPDIEKDFSAAAKFGNIHVGKDALFVEDLSVLYISLDELASVQLDIQGETAGTCCNLGAVTTHDVTVSTHSGESLRFKVVNVAKALNALRQAIAQNGGIKLSITGDIAPFMNRAN